MFQSKNFEKVLLVKEISKENKEGKSEKNDKVDIKNCMENNVYQP